MSELTLDQVWEVAHKLEKFIDNECNENSEICELLIQLSRYPGYLRDEVYQVVVEELQRQLDWYEQTYEIVETTETYTRTITELVEK